MVNRTGRGSIGRGGPSVVIEEIISDNGGAEDDGSRTASPMTSSHTAGRRSSPPRRHQQEQRGVADRPGSSSSAPAVPDHRSAPANREASPPAERPVERKSYALARRTRSRPADLGSKQASVEETAGGVSTPASTGGKSWATGDSPSQTAPPPPPGLALDQDLARMNLSGQNWSQNPTSYLRSELRGKGETTRSDLPILSADYLLHSVFDLLYAILGLALSHSAHLSLPGLEPA